MKIGLVLEGGGMRGLYTAGVLDTLMAENWRPHYVVGVSAGACHAASFVSGQRGRAYRTNMDYLGDSRYLSFRNYLKTGSLFGMKFIFETVPDHLDPYDYEAMLASPIDYEIGVTDVDTGKGVFYSKEALYHDCTLLSASSSIPVFSPIVEYQPEPLDREKLLAEAKPNQFQIRREDGVYVVEADWLSRVLGMVDVDDYESLQYFQRVLRLSGIIDKLEEMGVQEGDLVSILGFEFEYLR